MRRNKGVFGFKRFTSIGPLTFSQNEEDKEIQPGLSTDEIEDMLLDIIDENNLDPDNPSQDDIQTAVSGLANRMFDEDDLLDMPGPGGLPKQIAFEVCMESDWVRKWESGIREVTTELASEFETVIIRANGCEGVVNAEDPFATQLIFQEGCVGCRIKWLTIS